MLRCHQSQGAWMSANFKDSYADGGLSLIHI